MLAIASAGVVVKESGCTSLHKARLSTMCKAQHDMTYGYICVYRQYAGASLQLCAAVTSAPQAWNPTAGGIFQTPS
jgi:hypothetical protein